ncbi:hypothetical protein C4D60_Mb09t00840 [Musa balbisiana]|uniref:Uncharacterized protein n=1 Tax=Musa balbisiana TaxID=52838 RepID=A0A4V4H2Y1_MUSBA|nr:hypothetical protein C4D60_Mb09t00840 [Musa balbisiana]
MLAIRSVLRDAMADFSILSRIRSLRSLLKFLRSSVGSDDSIRLFLRSPTIPQLRATPWEPGEFRSQPKPSSAATQAFWTSPMLI